MIRLSLALLFCFSLLASDDKVAQEMARLDGTWTMVSGSRGGTAMPDEMVKTAKRVVKDGETTVHFGDTLFMKAKFTVDPSKDPKTIDYTISEGADKGKHQLGIYELNDDELKICFAAVGADRPTTFETKPGDGLTSSVWKKEK